MHTQDWQQVYIETQTQHQRHFDALQAIVKSCDVPMEGGCFGDGEHVNASVERNRHWVKKQANLFHAGAVSKNIMEIGVNAGHSTLIFLIANDTSQLTLFDLGNHSYTRPCVNYLMTHFPNRIRVFYGNSADTVPHFLFESPWEKHTFDFIHIDGGHETHQVRADILNARHLAAPNGLVISDDDNYANIHAVNREMVESNVWKEQSSGFYDTSNNAYSASAHFIASFTGAKP